MQVLPCEIRLDSEHNRGEKRHPDYKKRGERSPDYFWCGADLTSIMHRTDHNRCRALM